MAGERMGKVLLAIIFLFLLGGCLSPQEPEEKIGVLHMERLVARSAMAQSFQQQLDERGLEIQQEYAIFSESLDDASRAQKQQEAYLEFLQYKEDLEQELNAIIQEKVAAICQELDLRIVLDKEGIQFGGIDITDEVIKALEEEI